MSTKSRESIYGTTIRMSAERAKDARKEADRLACEAWNYRMLGHKGPAHPSPALSDALNAGDLYLEVRCLDSCHNQDGCARHRSAKTMPISYGTRRELIACAIRAADRLASIACEDLPVSGFGRPIVMIIESVVFAIPESSGEVSGADIRTSFHDGVTLPEAVT